MKIVVAAAGISLLAGIALGAWFGSDDGDQASVAGSSDRVLAQGAAEDRLLRLEQIIAEEREARIALEDSLAILFEEIDRLDGVGVRQAAQRQAEIERQREARTSERSGSRNEAEWMRTYQERRVGRMVEGGFSEDEARRILEKESEAAFKSLQATWDAQRKGDPVNLLDASNSPQAILRSDIGDDAYARYLESQGQPTAIRITQVMSGSPGSSIGLQAGDELVTYNGQRVFDVMDLRNQTMQGEPGEDVVIEVDRDGMRLQLTVPRGPIGFTGSGANVRGISRWGG